MGISVHLFLFLSHLLSFFDLDLNLHHYHNYHNVTSASFSVPSFGGFSTFHMELTLLFFSTVVVFKVSFYYISSRNNCWTFTSRFYVLYSCVVSLFILKLFLLSSYNNILTFTLFIPLTFLFCFGLYRVLAKNSRWYIIRCEIKFIEILLVTISNDINVGDINIISPAVHVVRFSYLGLTYVLNVCNFDLNVLVQ